MGGAGFPTGVKWEIVANATGTTKYVICNADESEPGTFKDRVILAELPQLVIEGMLLAALTVGAEEGIVFIRHEYESERAAFEEALDDAKKRGMLGENAAGSGRRFEIEVFVSPGGYILGEETALLEALEDRRGEPRNKPPYPGQVGLYGKPTLINNVETLALATAIVHHGPDWWHAQGEGDASGLKFVSISGDVANPGVYEIPSGLTVAALIERAGGMRDGTPLKAFLPGGASSNFLTAAHAETPLEFDAMRAAGSMLGTGAVIVVSEGRDLFELATNLVRFFRNESCGKCVPCRVGSEKAVEILESVHAGSGDARQLDVLPDLAETLEQTSICGLGQVALNPVVSMMRHFRDDLPPGCDPLDDLKGAP
jgi:NADH:ubiquinone oxidoreductase subunit F (NADH-binding)